MECVNSIRIQAPRQRIFDLAANVERWPELLPHYRWVRVRGNLAGGRRIVEMAANRDGIPVRWIAIESLDPASATISFRHIGGLTTGMEVAWTLREERVVNDIPIVETRIFHHFAPAWPPVAGPWLAHHIVGEFFVSNIADKTLAHIKHIAEHSVTPEGQPWSDG